MRKLFTIFTLFTALVTATAHADTITKGTTGVLFNMFIQDRATTSNVAGKTGLAYNSSGLRCRYMRDGGSDTAITLVSGGSAGTWTDSTFVQVSSTNRPGTYQLSIPNAAFAVGAAKWVDLQCGGVANMDEIIKRWDLVDYPTQSDGQVAGVTSGTQIQLASGQNTGRANQQLCFQSGSSSGQCVCISSQDGTNTILSSSKTVSANDWYGFGPVCSTSGGSTTTGATVK